MSPERAWKFTPFSHSLPYESLPFGFLNFVSGGFFLFVCLFFRPCQEACGISVPAPGIERMHPAWEAQNLNHWTAREAPGCF